MKPFLNDSWWAVMKSEFEQPYYQELREWMKEEYRTQTVFPKPDDVYRALHLTSYEEVKVVILGQDPYHGRSGTWIKLFCSAWREASAIIEKYFSGAKG